MKILLVANYNGIRMEITVMEGAKSEAEATRIVDTYQVALDAERIIIDGREGRRAGDVRFERYIENSDVGYYTFRACKKALHPLDPRGLSDEELQRILCDERFMTTPDDHVDLGWKIADAYAYISRAYGSAQGPLQFDVLSYKIEQEGKPC